MNIVNYCDVVSNRRTKYLRRFFWDNVHSEWFKRDGLTVVGVHIAESHGIGFPKDFFLRVQSDRTLPNGSIDLATTLGYDEQTIVFYTLRPAKGLSLRARPVWTSKCPFVAHPVFYYLFFFASRSVKHEPRKNVCVFFRS